MATIYVIGEYAARGPVKIGMTETRGSSTGRAGMSSGNWRQLHKLAELEVDLALLRWSEWRIHQSLRPWHRGGEWYAVRPLLAEWGGSWKRLLRASISGRIDGGGDPNVGTRGHRLITVERVGTTRPLKFRARCSCGVIVRGAEGHAFLTVLRKYCVQHIEIDPPPHLRARPKKT